MALVQRLTMSAAELHLQTQKQPPARANTPYFITLLRGRAGALLQP